MKRSILLVVACLLAVLLIVLVIVAGNLSKGADATPSSQSTGVTHNQPSDLPPAASTQPEQTQPAIPETTQPPAPEISPDRVGIYIPAADGSKARVLLTEFSAPRTAKKDIDCFEILATNVSRAEGSSFSAIWTEAWNNHGNAENAKIGFHIAFTLADGTQIDQTILKPSDAKGFYDYLEVYLYDDIHTGGGWYTHLEDHNIDEETVITSIKLTSGSKITEVGDISLTAFIYNSEACFDANGNYIGDVLQTLMITE